MAKTAKKSTKSAKKNSTGKGADAHRKAILALPAASVSPPQIPVYHLLGEARALEKVATKYAAELRRVGVDKPLIESVAARSDALSNAQGELALVRKSKRTKTELQLEQASIELRRDMIADGRYALRDDADAQATLTHVQEGEGLDDLVQDLRDMSGFHRQYASALAKVGVNAAAKAKKATELAGALSDALAGRRTGGVDERAAIDLRNRAATYLTTAMREIREAGAYAFRATPEIASRFRGTYVAHHRPRKKSPAPTTKPAAGNGQATAG